MAGTSPPKGCGSNISSIYYNLCDLTIVWGVVLEAIAAAGVMTSFVLFIILMACLPFVTDKKRKGMVALQASILVFTLGLFGLTFAFIVGQYSTSCAARRFLFGIMFSGCLACLVMHGLWLSLLRRSTHGPRSWMLWLGALGLWLVEVIINTEWLVLTMVRSPSGGSVTPYLPCSTTNEDFVMALIYVGILTLAVIVTVSPSLTHKHKQWRRDGVFILVTGLLTMAIWVVWIFMYVRGNQVIGKPSWDDPTLAVAVVSNAWVFLFFYTIPEICLLTQVDPDQEQPFDVEDVYPARSVVYDNTVKVPEPTRENLYVENKAFTMEEPPTAESTKPESPYGVYNGQLRSGVYQPTEIALISRGLTMMDSGVMIPRAITPSLKAGSHRSSLSRSVESLTSQGLS